MVFFNSPNNPSGTIYTEEEYKALAKVLEKYPRIFILSDEIYEHINYNNPTFSFAAIENMYDRTITVNGLAKAFAMTGWRVGYFAGPKNLITHLGEIHHGFAICAPAVSQHAALAALKGSQECVTDMRKIMEERRDILCRGLDEINIPYSEPQGGYYVYALSLIHI